MRLNVRVPLPTPNPYVESLTPQCDGVRRQGLYEAPGHEGGALSGKPRELPPFSVCEDTG